jgi:hypothetical protein
MNFSSSTMRTRGRSSGAEDVDAIRDLVFAAGAAELKL